MSQKSVAKNPLFLYSFNFLLLLIIEIAFILLLYFLTKNSFFFLKKKPSKKHIRRATNLSRAEKKRKEGREQKRNGGERSTNYWSTSLLRDLYKNKREGREGKQSFQPKHAHGTASDIRGELFRNRSVIFKGRRMMSEICFYVARTDNQTNANQKLKGLCNFGGPFHSIWHERAHTTIVLRSNKTCEIVHPRDLSVRIYEIILYLSVTLATDETSHQESYKSQTRTWRKCNLHRGFAFLSVQLPVLRDDCSRRVGFRLTRRKEHGLNSPVTNRISLFF